MQFIADEDSETSDEEEQLESTTSGSSKLKDPIQANPAASSPGGKLATKTHPGSSTLHVSPHEHTYSETSGASASDHAANSARLGSSSPMPSGLTGLRKWSYMLKSKISGAVPAKLFKKPSGRKLTKIQQDLRKANESFNRNLSIA